jgi:hypothetical protein
MSAVGKVGARRVGAGLALALILSISGPALAPAAALYSSEPTTYAVLVPIVTVQSGNDLVTVEELTAATSRGGIWSTLTDSAIEHGATIALDSRIVASISALGDDAPVAVSGWMDRVVRSGPIYLPWGNADPFLFASFSPSFRVSALGLSKISGVPAADIVGWPTGRAGNDRSLSRAQTLGYSTLIANDAVFPRAGVTLSHRSSELVRSAVSPGSTVDLKKFVRENGYNFSTWGSAFALPRDPRDIDSVRAAQFLDLLFAGSATARPFEPIATSALKEFRSMDVPARAIRSLASQHRTDQQVSVIATDPSVISTPRLRRLSIIAGMVGHAEFVTEVRSYTRAAKSFDEFITFTVGSDFTVLADSADLPLTVSNSSASDITVVATVDAVSGIVNIAQPQQTITVPAGSSAQVTVPMSSVANGRTSLRATLTTTDGIPVTEPAYIAIDVQAQWEGLTLIGFISVVSTLLTIGIVRTVRDRRNRS